MVCIFLGNKNHFIMIYLNLIKTTVKIFYCNGYLVNLFAAWVLSYIELEKENLAAIFESEKNCLNIVFSSSGP